MGSQSANNFNVAEGSEKKYKIKKCHFLDGKNFVIIDKSIMDQLPQDGDIYFKQELADDNCIILRVTDLHYVKDM